jgi:cytochrome P450
MTSAAQCPHLNALLDQEEAALSQPYAAWAELRALGPVVWVDRLNSYVVTDYDAVEAALLDHETFSCELGNPRGPVMEHRLEQVRAELAESSPEFRELRDRMVPNWRANKVLLGADGDRHTTHRSVVQGMFSVRRANALEPYIRSVAAQMVSRLRPNEPIDITEDFLSPLPLEVIASQLGIDHDHIPDFRRWATDNNSTIGNDKFDSSVVLSTTRSLVEFADYFRGLMADRRVNPQDDFVTKLVQFDPEDGSMNDEFRLNILSQLIGAGNETSTKTLAMAMVVLADRPDLLEQVSQDRSLIPALIDELIRLASATQGLFRHTRHDTVLAGVPIPANSSVLVLYASANRTESHFPNPDEVVLNRPNVNTHLAFGKGKHFCVGAPLAKVIVTTGMDVLLDRFDSWTVEPDGVSWNDSYLLFGPSSLRVRLHERAIVGASA